jgi:hypothetical protein
LELVFNGRVVHSAATEPLSGCFQAEIRHILQVDEPGWFAIRIPADVGNSELGHPLFAHTSPIYVRVGGQSLFRPEVAQSLIDEMRESMETIRAKGTFSDDAERQQIFGVYEQAIDGLEKRIQSVDAP